LSAGQARSLLDWREKLESVLAFSADEEGISEEVREMLLRRAEAREKKQWALSDALRDQLLATGWQVKDTKEGQKLSRRS
jgi:cysteinyl-tRNA synthetase